MRRPLLLVAFALLLFTTPASTAQQTHARYEGPLYDSHVHLGDDGFGGLYVDVSTEQGVAGTLFFAPMNATEPDIGWEDARRRFEGKQIRARFFIAFEPHFPEHLDTRPIAGILDAVPGRFQGVGEFALYRPEWRGVSLQDERWERLFAFAAERNLTVMIHPRADQARELETALTEHPGTRFLVHGLAPTPALGDLLREHPNMRFTLDASQMLTNMSRPPPGNRLWPGSDGGAFERQFDAQRASLLGDAVRDWAPVIAAAPDRVLWGTDVGSPLMIRAPAYERIIGFSREFIARLPEAHREPFAYGNALREFGPGEEVPALAWHESPAPGSSAMIAALAGATAIARRWRPRR